MKESTLSCCWEKSVATFLHSVLSSRSVKVFPPCEVAIVFSALVSGPSNVSECVQK